MQIQSNDGALSDWAGGQLIQWYLQDIQGNLLVSMQDLENPLVLLSKLRNDTNRLSEYLQTKFSTKTRTLLAHHQSLSQPSDELKLEIVNDLNRIIQNHDLYDKERFESIPWGTDAAFQKNPQGVDLIRLNRLLLESAYNDELKKSNIEVNLPETKILSLSKEWIQLPNTDDTWEHTQWLDVQMVQDLFGNDLNRGHFRTVDLQVRSLDEQGRMVLAEKGAVVAVVDENGRFDRVIDRQDLVEKVVQTVMQKGDK